MNSTPSLAPAPTIAVLGAGRLGAVLARALREAGYTVEGPLGRDDKTPHVDLAILCVPDAEIAGAAASVRSRALRVAHVSGATGLDDVDLSIHPLQTFAGGESPEVFVGIGAAIDGRTDADLALAAELATALGMRAFRVDEAHRAGYHAAASFASNFVLAVLDAAEELASEVGVERAHLVPLVRRTVENWAASGAPAVLTGPIARGDAHTLARQRAAVDGYAPHLIDLFEELANATRDVASRMPTAIGRADDSIRKDDA
ncbi:Rossmann-like and DUF2520 domain-containing protein [Microbacterium sp. 1.5R]|uniref:Rossmann-like and DUF2520 domain-containing protein n=1 Tax=Microbacterium sp. 1.5R TaxID=1916917 RepID=UPI0011A7A20C|nr:Rossmann-like and DUF2520 domain-containing protein [Microbacterium sp. 1.5R]